MNKIRGVRNVTFGERLFSLKTKIFLLVYLILQFIKVNIL